MCNENRNRVAAGLIKQGFEERRMPLRFPEGVPNLEPRDSIRITDRNAIVRTGEDGAAELVVRRWSWPSPSGKPVYNLRSEGRRFTSGRCLIVTDGFYEFTDPVTREGRKSRRKQKWLFTMRGEPWFCIAGIWRAHPEVGEAYTMLTTAPGADMAPYHDRQVVVLGPGQWSQWLDPRAEVADLLRPAPAGTLEVRAVEPPSESRATSPE